MEKAKMRSFWVCASFRLSHRPLRACSFAQTLLKPKNPRTAWLRYFLSASVKNGFGRAVSRILSAPCGGENHLSERPIPETCPLSRDTERAAPRFPIWPCTRWGFPCRVACASRGALLPHLFTLTVSNGRRRFIFCGTFRRRLAAPPAYIPAETSPGYTASRSLVFGLSSPGLLRERFSALPKPV